MLYETLLVFTLVTFNFKLSNGQLRITNGTEQIKEKKYMVYFVKAKEKSALHYDAWICGGAIVSPLYIITAAACLRDVDFMYAIAGYNKYMNQDKILTDACTKETMKKVVYTCVPKVYKFAYDKVESWSSLDIGLAKVESEYKFGEAEPAAGCSWPVDKIDINYNPRFSKPDVDAFVLGWGHEDKWRLTSETEDRNMETLQTTSTKIIPKEVCQEAYKNISEELTDIIDKYMICADGVGGITSDGQVIDEENQDRDNCAGLALRTARCQNLLRNKRISRNYFPSVNLTDQTWTEDLTRRHGICQNDHGGPLVTWIGAHEFLIGVASVFKIDESYQCVGPYLYTSTACNSRFLSCFLPPKAARTLASPYYRAPLVPQQMEERATLSPEKLAKSPQNQPEEDDNIEFSNLRRAVPGKDRLSYCHQPPALRGFDVIERKISWKHHPDGPAANERYGDTKPHQAIPPRPIAPRPIAPRPIPLRPIPLRPIAPQPIPANPYRPNPLRPNPIKSIPIRLNPVQARYKPPPQHLWNRKPQGQWNARPQINVQLNAKPQTNVQWNPRPQLNKPWNARPQISKVRVKS